MNNIEKYKEFIKRVLYRYHTVSDESLSLLFSITQIQDFKKGESLLPLGKISNHIHILYQGAIVSCFLDYHGNMYHKNIFLEGDFVGSMVSALKNEPSNFDLEVIENSTLISFPYKKFRELIDKKNDLKDFYIAYLEKNWVIEKEKREIEIVLKEAKERYLEYINAHPNIENRVPLHYIASHLGITPTQLSRIRKNIKKSPFNQHM